MSADSSAKNSSVSLFSSSGHPVCERLIFSEPESLPRLAVFVDKTDYGSREKIDLGINMQNSDSPAHLSVSVRKSENQFPDPPASIVDFLLLSSELQGNIENPGYYHDNVSVRSEEALDNLMLVHGWRQFSWQPVLFDSKHSLVYVPDFRGNLLSGKVVSTQDNTPAANQMVHLAVPGSDYLFFASRTNLQGEFFFFTNEIESETDIVLQIDPKVADVLEVRLDDSFWKNHQLQLSQMLLDSSMTGFLQERSVATQIENAYFEAKADSIDNGQAKERFYRQADRVYYLEEYTRFGLMEEVIRELVGTIFIKKNQNDYTFRVKDYRNKHVVFKDPPLVLIDGVAVFDINEIINYDPLKIEKIQVVAQRYLYGPMVCNGIVSFETYDGGFDGFELEEGSKRIRYQGLQPSKVYFSPKYDSPSLRESRIPDFRTQLHWAPMVKTDKYGNASLSFYSSDVSGSYQVTIQGVTEDGQPVSSNGYFTVQEKVQ